MAGRKRDEALDDAIRQEAFDLLRQVGWPQFTVEAVADRLAIPKSTIYKRWPSRVGLAVAVLGDWLQQMTGEHEPPRPSALRERLIRLVGQELSVAGSPHGRAVAQLLLAGPATDDEAIEPLRTRTAEYRAALQTMLDVDPTSPFIANVDVDLLVDMLLGAVWIRSAGGSSEQKDPEMIVDRVLRMLKLPPDA